MTSAGLLVAHLLYFLLLLVQLRLHTYDLVLLLLVKRPEEVDDLFLDAFILKILLHQGLHAWCDIQPRSLLLLHKVRVVLLESELGHLLELVVFVFGLG